MKRTTTAMPAGTERLQPADPARVRDALTPPTDDESSRVVARPDGFYWVADDGHQEFGPYATAQDALVALRADTGLEPDETLEEAESEIGFVDPKVVDEGLPEA